MTSDSTITMTGAEYDVIIARARKAERERDALREALEQIVPLTDVHEALGVSALHSVIRDICNIARAALEAKS